MHSARSGDPVHAERIRAIYGQMPLTLAVTILNAAFVAIVLTPVESPLRLWSWFGAVLVACGARLASWYIFTRIPRQRQEASSWERLATGGGLLAGCLWGFGSIFWFPTGELYQLFVALVIAGMCAGAATVHATHIPTVAAFVLPATVPLAGQFFAIGGPLQIVSGAMTLVFGGAMCAVSFRFQGWFVATFATQFKLAQRTRELDWANARLREEIASRIAAEQRLQESARLEATGRVAAGIAHDVNNLLTAISGVTEALVHKLGHDPRYANQFATISRATERGAALTHQLLAFGREQELQARPTDINRVVAEMGTLLAASVPPNVAVDLQLDPLLKPALADAQQIEHAILNIVINARDAMPEGGRITITTANVDIIERTIALGPGHYVAIVIADTGVGMPEQVQARAFEPFFTTKPAGKGSGLGLSQVHGLTHQLGGTTTLDSVPGKGTTVCMYLPVDGQPVPSQSDTPTATAPASAPTSAAW